MKRTLKLHLLSYSVVLLFDCRYVLLNGRQRLMMLSDDQLPTFQPVHLPPGSRVTLLPLTFGFFVFPDADATAC